MTILDLTTSEALRARIFESLDQAIKNDYDFEDDPPEEIADDLVNCDAELENQEPQNLLPHVEAWLARRL